MMLTNTTLASEMHINPEASVAFTPTIADKNWRLRAMTNPLLRRTLNHFAARLALVVGLILSAGSAPAQLGEQPEPVWIRTTNWVPRYLTNVIKVSIPTNTFYDEYRTNWVRQKITNVVDIFRTNYLTDYRTNLVPVNEFRTNTQVAYVTNLKTLTFTNFETVLQMRTNWITQPVTNVVDFTNTVLAQKTHTNLVTAYETNLVRAWQTNLKTLTFTNFETVLVMKTNWVNVPVTNVVEIELPAPKARPVAVTTPAPAKVEPAPKTEPAPVASAVDFAARMEFELTHTGKPAKPDQFPIRLVLKSTAATAILPVQEWRVEKVDGGVFMIGSRADFTGTLPAGTYRVTARLRAADNTIRSLRCQIDVQADGSAQRSPALAAPVR